MAADVNMSANASWLSPGAGITGDYDDTSSTFRLFVALTTGLALYNACELLIMILLSFRRYGGLYFWSMVVATAGIIPYALGFLLKFLNIASHPPSLRWLSVVLNTIGWWTMVTGQSVVLWSRLHLVLTASSPSGNDSVSAATLLRATKYMIIIDSIVLYIPTTVLTFGSNGPASSTTTVTFTAAYNIMEKIQMAGFFIQETILSGLYIFATLRLLRAAPPILQQTPAQGRRRNPARVLMYQLVAINVVIICMDLALLSLEAASLYILETLLKGVVYSIKLKLEFAILGKLVMFAQRGRNHSDLDADDEFSTASRNGSSGVVGYKRSASTARAAPVNFAGGQGSICGLGEEAGKNGLLVLDPEEFVDLSRVSTDISFPARTMSLSAAQAHRRRSMAKAKAAISARDACEVESDDGLHSLYEVAQFEHKDDVMRLPVSRKDSLKDQEVEKWEHRESIESG